MKRLGSTLLFVAFGAGCALAVPAGWATNFSASLDEAKSRQQPLLVYFTASWCGPCKMMAPDVDRLAAAKTGAALVAKLNTDLAQATSMRFNIRGIPTLLIFQEGQVREQLVGAQPKSVIEKALNKYLVPA